MPINLGYFTIRKPRVSLLNAVTTKAPTSQGTYTLLDAFTIEYVGSAASVLLFITGAKILTLVDENPLHVENLSIDVIGRTIQETINEINNNTNYLATPITSNLDDPSFFAGTIQTEIVSSVFTVQYSDENEYTIDVHTEGELGSAKVSVKENNFTYRGDLGKWSVDKGYIFDDVGVDVPLSGIVPLGTQGAEIKFFEADDANDLNSSVEYTDLELIRETVIPINNTTFQAAPILVPGTLDLKVNQVSLIQDRDFQLSTGIKAYHQATVASPYTVTSGNNILIARINSNDPQSFTLPLGEYAASEISSLINQTATGFSASSYRETETGEDFLKITSDNGTGYFQLRIEDGSANSLFGFQDFQASVGGGVGQIDFLTYVPNENIVPDASTNTVLLSAGSSVTGSTFLGVNTESLVLYENGVLKTFEEDYLVDIGGNVVFTEVSNTQAESLASAILKIDNDLFPSSYTIYDNGVALEPITDYAINTEGGWITLSSSIFPNHVLTATYQNKQRGIIENEVLIGGPAVLTGTGVSPFVFTSGNNELKVSVNNTASQIFTLPESAGLDISIVVDTINSTASGIIASEINGKLRLTTQESGPDKIIIVQDGSANSVLGFTEYQSVQGSGALGGERSFEVNYPPMETEGFTAPENGDTIIIKNNDVTGRYPAGALIKLISNYYQVDKSYLETKANLISKISEPFLILEGTNDTFKFTKDGGSEIEVTFTSGSEVTAQQIVTEINEVSPDSAFLININNINRIQLKANSHIKIGEGSANRTLGFDPHLEDDSTPDTFIITASKFSTTYLNPPMATSVAPVNFLIDPTVKLEVPANSNILYFDGDQTSKYLRGVLLKIDNLYFYKVASSELEESGVTIVTLESNLNTAIFEDTLIEHTESPIFEEGDINLKTKKIPVLGRPYVLRKNGSVLLPDVDYEITDFGDMELTEGMQNGDEYVFNYVARRFVDSTTTINVSYNYYDFLRVGSNIKVSYLAHNPDNFYVNVRHGTTVMDELTDDLETLIQQQNATSFGFPDNTIPVMENEDGGNASYYTKIGIIDDKIEAARRVFEFYDNRLKYFDLERQYISGWVIGGTGTAVVDPLNPKTGYGRIDYTNDIKFAGENPSVSTRLFPVPDDREDAYRQEPYKVPALHNTEFYLGDPPVLHHNNENDDGDDSFGTISPPLINPLDNEVSLLGDALSGEVEKLNTLSGISTSLKILDSGIVTLTPTTNLELYVEIDNGGLQQRNITVSSWTGGIFSITNVRDDINNKIDNEFGLPLGTINCASVNGSQIRFTADSGSYAKCIYIKQSPAELGFTQYDEASLRSRHTLWTGGSTYAITVPSDKGSVHLIINDENNERDDIVYWHTIQIDQLNGQMEEWLGVYADAFDKAKAEKDSALQFIDNISGTSYFTGLSTTFRDSKFLDVFHALDSGEISTRLTQIGDTNNGRIKDILDRKDHLLNTRLPEIINTLDSENLQEPRYAWIYLLVHRINGFFSEKKREVDNEIRKQREAANNEVINDSLSNLL